MKLTVERDPLLAAVTALRATILPNSQIPILGCLKLVADGCLRIEGHALDYCGSADVAAEIAAPGATAVDAQRLYSLLTGLPKGSHLKIEHAETTLAIAGGRARYKLPTLPADDFPSQFAISDDAECLRLEPGEVKQLFRRTAYAVCADTKTRMYLCGAYLHEVGGKLNTVATDGIVLAWAQTEIGAKKIKPVIVPDRAMSQVVKMAGDTISLSWDDKLIRAVCGNLTYASKLLDGTYPAYPRVVPDKKGEYLVFDRDSLLAAFERLASVDARGPAIMTWEAGAGSVRLTRDGLGNGDEELECEPMAAEGNIPFGVDPTIATLQAFTGDAIRIRIPDGEGAALFLDPKDSAFSAVLMPSWLWYQKPKAAAA